jgi:hypothetical protein
MISKDKISKIVADSVKKLVIEELPGRIEDAINEHMYEMVEDEVSRYTEYKLSMTLENVSKTHGIPLDLLLRDVAETNKSGGCKGTKTTIEGTKRCSFRAVHDGYCRYHKAQGERIKRRHLPSKNLHTHGPEQMNVSGCPGCENSNSYLDLNKLMCEEIQKGL